MIFITGMKVIEEFIRSQMQHLSELFVMEGVEISEIQPLIESAMGKGIPLKRVSRDEMERLSGGRKVKKGIGATIGTFAYFDLNDIIESKQEESTLVMLDRIHDPHNLGAIARTAYCFGADGIIIQERRAPSVTAASIEASAGTLAHIPVVKVTNLSKTLDILVTQGFWTYVTVSESPEDDMDQHDFRGNVLIILGSEGEGVRQKLREKSDFTISIPIQSDFDSLNVSVSAGIILYALAKKRVGSKP